MKAKLPMVHYASDGCGRDTYISGGLYDLVLTHTLCLEDQGGFWLPNLSLHRYVLNI